MNVADNDRENVDKSLSGSVLCTALCHKVALLLQDQCRIAAC